MQKARLGVTEMAASRSRHRSTSYRELARNFFRYPNASRRAGATCPARGAAGPCHEPVAPGWSPQQIAGRIRQEAEADGTGDDRLSRETIYRHVWPPGPVGAALFVRAPGTASQGGAARAQPPGPPHSVGARDRVPSGGRGHTRELRPLGGRLADLCPGWRRRQRDDPAGAPQPLCRAAGQPRPPAGQPARPSGAAVLGSPHAGRGVQRPSWDQLGQSRPSCGVWRHPGERQRHCGLVPRRDCP